MTPDLVPRVSVLMPVFNTARYVSDALSSIADQTFTDFELVVLDDGSTDGSLEIVRAFAEREPRTRVIEQPNRGLIDSRNRLLSEARGEFIAWMDSDDLSIPDRLMRQVEAFDADAELVCTGTQALVVDPDGLPLGKEEYPELHDAIRAQQLTGGGFRFPSTMQRRSIAVTVGGFRHPFRMGEDLDFLLRVAELGRVGNLPDFLYVYRQHLGNTCAVVGKSWLRYRDLVLELAAERRDCGSDRLQRGGTIAAPDVGSSDARRFVPWALLQWAAGASGAGDRRRALRYTFQAISADPLHAPAWRYLAKLILRME